MNLSGMEQNKFWGGGLSAIWENTPCLLGSASFSFVFNKKVIHRPFFIKTSTIYSYDPGVCFYIKLSCDGVRKIFKMSKVLGPVRPCPCDALTNIVRQQRQRLAPANTYFDVSEWRRRPPPIMSLSHNYYNIASRPLYYFIITSCRRSTMCIYCYYNTIFITVRLLCTVLMDHAIGTGYFQKCVHPPPILEMFISGYINIQRRHTNN